MERLGRMYDLRFGNIRRIIERSGLDRGEEVLDGGIPWEEPELIVQAIRDVMGGIQTHPQKE